MLNACIDLGLVFKCSPMEFLDLPEHVALALYRMTVARLRETSDRD